MSLRVVNDSIDVMLVLADHTKYAVSAFSVFAAADKVDVLVTDAGFKHSEALEALGTESLKAVQGGERP